MSYFGMRFNSLLFDTRSFLRALFSDLFFYKAPKIYTAILFLLNLGTFSYYFYLKSKIVQDMAILHYNVLFGIDNLGPIENLISRLFYGLSVSIINFILALLLIKKDKLIVHFLFLAAILFNIYLLISLFTIQITNI